MRPSRSIDRRWWWAALAAAFVALPVRAQTFEPIWLAVHATLIAAAEEALLLRAGDGSLWASEDDLRAWGVAPAGTAETVEARRWYALAVQPGVASRFDPAEQALWLDVDPNLRNIQVRGLAGEAARPDTQTADPGGWVDFDLQGTHAGSHDTLAGLVDGSVFNGYGFGSSSAFFEDKDVVRLDTTWTIDDPGALQRIDLGDGIHDGAALGRAVRFGGVSVGTDFSLQPDLVTFPVPDLRGVARLPSTLDIYVNGLLARRESVDAGPFVVTEVPGTTGQGEARVVMRDLLGREQLVTQPFYGSTRLLKPGLSDWRLDGGWLREDYGFASNRYGVGFLARRKRVGLTPRFTIEGSAEVDRSRLAAGGTAAMAVPFGGIAHLGLAAGDGRAGAGGRLETGFDFQRGGYGGRGWSFGARLHRSTARWTDLGESQPSRERGESANVAMGLFPGASAGLTWSRSDTVDEPVISVVTLDLGARVTPTWFVTANVARIREHDDDWFAGLSVVGLWGRGTTIAETRRDDGQDLRRLEWQNDARDALDDRCRVRAQDGYDPRLYAQGDWNGLRGGVSAAVEDDERETAWRAGATTRVAWLGDDVFWTRPGPDGFAVIDTNGLADVGVLQENRPAGRTDARGLALLPGLRPWQANRVALVDGDIPIEADVDSLEQLVVPARRGGMRVAFPVRSEGGHAVQLRMADGSVPPRGSTVRDPATDVRLPLASDGTAWWALGEMPSTLEVRMPGRTCVAHPSADGGEALLECGS